VPNVKPFHQVKIRSKNSFISAHPWRRQQSP